MDDDADLFDDDDAIDWRQHIHADPNILVGKPVIKGTRISVDLVLEYLAYGHPRTEILESFPRLTDTSIQACVEFAREAVRAYPREELRADG